MKIASFALLVAFLAAPAASADDTALVVVVCDDSGACRHEPAPEASSRPDTPMVVANHIENSGYDNTAATGLLRAWTFMQDVADPGNSAVWTSLDRNSNPASGSALVTSAVPDVPAFYPSIGLWQCFPYMPPGNVGVSGYIYIPTGQPYDDNGVTLRAAAYFYIKTFTDLNCTVSTGTSTGGGVSIQASTAGSWRILNWGPVSLPPTTRSLRFGTLVSREVAAGLTLPPNAAYFDDVTLSTSSPWLPMKGDSDRDGETDLMLHNNTTGDNYVWSMKDENLDSGPTAITPSAASLDWQIATVDDFDLTADGRDDLLLWNSVTGAAEFWMMNGAARVGAAVPLSGLPLPWKPSAAADFDLDGNPDIIWRNYDTQKIQLWTMNGPAQVGTITPSPDQAVDANWEIVGAPDIDKNGQTDLLWYNWSSGKIVYWTMKYSSSAAECSGVGLTAPCYYRITGAFTTPPNAGDANWKVLATGDYGIGPANSSGTPMANTTDLIWRNASSGRMVLWFMDNTGTRTGGLFVTPDPPAPATDWTIAGPR